ncbi:hypothetical protein AVEN_60246-1 [Araneus ventricosus]|uniref:Uncharacterized protein n=1 Tax=Araneus ventricosus TaxID=182803 RepID=A0A4Y2D0H1_ARAVE|nr:hypothetical protein AVEN_60246-1 [Araneus ventricosus]
MNYMITKESITTSRPCHTVRPISVTGVEEIRRLRSRPSCDSRSSARCRHWGDAASPGTFSGAGTDGSRWEKNRDERRDGQVPPNGTTGAVIWCTAPHEGEPVHGGVSQRLPSVPGRSSISLMTTMCRRATVIGWPRSPGWISSTPVHRNWSHGLTRVSIPVVLVLRCSRKSAVSVSINASR